MNKKKILLPDITLIAVDSSDVEGTQLALNISARNIKFGSIKLLSSSAPKSKLSFIEHIPINQMDYLGYNKMIIKELYKYIDTKFCLIVQSDGFVINSDFWDNKFLSYDYVGSPWPNKVKITTGGSLIFDKNKVGNGGFSLRSKKLLEITSKIDFDKLTFPIKSEDIIICHYMYEDMVKSGIAFAPVELAVKFAIESPNNVYNQDIDTVFGFHGRHLREKVLKKIHSELKL